MDNDLNITNQTGLQKLTTEQLINIILRKDNMEQKLIAEVKKLRKTNKQLTKLIEELDELINDYNV